MTRRRITRAALLAAAGVLALAGSALPTLPAAADDPVWSSPLALGPTDATSIAAREGLVVAGGRLHMKDSIGVVPSPRTSGLFWSTDAGRSWRLGQEPVPLPDGTVELRDITATPDLVAVSPAGPEAYATFGTEVWRSADAGPTWTRVGSVPGAPTVLDFLPDGRLVAGLAGGGLRATADRGQTWTTAGTGLPNSRVNEILTRTTTVVLVATDAGLYRSMDAGATFTQVTLGLISASAAALGVTGDGTLGTYLAMQGTPTSIYYSSDNGATWQLRPPAHAQNSVLPAVSKGALEMVVQSSITIVYAGTNLGLYRTTLTSSTAAVWGWERVDPEPGALAVSELAFADIDPSPLRSHALFAAVKRSSPAVVEATGVRLAAPGWIDELEGGRICGGLVTRTDGKVFAACGRHMFGSSDGGATWLPAGRGLPYISIGIGDTPYFPLAAGADGSLWTSGFHYGLWHSNAAVTSWSKVPIPAASVGIVEPHPTNPMVVFAAGLLTNGNTGAFWRTENGGTTWEPIDDVPDNVYTVDISPKAPNRVLVATFDGGGWLSEDAGDTWTKSTGLPEGSQHLYRAYFSDADAMRGWALGNGGESEYSLYRSDDGGKSWVESGPARLNGAVKATYDIAPSPWEADGVYSLSIDGDLIATHDGGQTWALLDSGLPKHPTCNICEEISHLTLDAGTPGRMYIAAGVLGSGVAPQSMWVYRGVDAQAAG